MARPATVDHAGVVATKNWEDARRYFEPPVIAHLATLMSDGSPHTVPVWVGVDEGVVCFYAIAGSVKDRNLLADPRAALSVVSPDEPLDMAFVRGTVERIDGAAARAIADLIATKYTGALDQTPGPIVAFHVQPVAWWAHDHSAG
jgi:PPOX class probable F420-dependent enzyme